MCVSLEATWTHAFRPSTRPHLSIPPQGVPTKSLFPNTQHRNTGQTHLALDSSPDIGCATGSGVALFACQVVFRRNDRISAASGEEHHLRHLGHDPATSRPDIAEAGAHAPTSHTHTHTHIPMLALALSALTTSGCSISTPGVCYSVNQSTSRSQCVVAHTPSCLCTYTHARPHAIMFVHIHTRTATRHPH